MPKDVGESNMSADGPRFARAVAERDVDHVTIGVGGKPGQIAGVFIEEFAHAHRDMAPLTNVNYEAVHGEPAH